MDNISEVMRRMEVYLEHKYSEFTNMEFTKEEVELIYNFLTRDFK